MSTPTIPDRPARAGAAVALGAALALSACASLEPADPLPYLRYATAGSYMDYRTAMTGAPDQTAFQYAVQNWTNAIADSASCRLPAGQVTQAGLVAAVELAAMSAFAQRREGGPSVSEMGRYAADMALAAGAADRLPSRGRCARLSRWLPEVNHQGGDAVRRATLNGLRRGLFGGGL
jgi:hypothetical protein